MQSVLPGSGSGNSNRDRAEQAALPRLGRLEDCAKVVEFLRPSSPTTSLER
jgi:hypothetical protein